MIDSKIIFQVVGKDNKFFFIRNKGSENIGEQHLILKEIQEIIEKGEKYDHLVFEIQDQPHDGTCNVVVNKVLQQQNKALTERVKELENRLVKYTGKCINYQEQVKQLAKQLHKVNDDYNQVLNNWGKDKNKINQLQKERDELYRINQKQIENNFESAVVKERDQLKSKIERIRVCPFMTRCSDCGMSGVPMGREDKQCGNCNSFRTEIVIRESTLKEILGERMMDIDKQGYLIIGGTGVLFLSMAYGWIIWSILK